MGPWTEVFWSMSNPDATTYETDFLCDNCGDDNEGRPLVLHPMIASDEYVCDHCADRLWRAGDNK